MQVTVQTRDNMKVFVAEVLRVVRKERSTTSATFLSLTGPVGAGKTTFVQMLAALLGITEPVTSPTFILRSEYETTDETFSRLVHVDAYRIDGDRDGSTVGWDDFSHDSHTLVAVEWPEQVTTFLPQTCRKVSIQVAGTTRSLSFV